MSERSFTIRKAEPADIPAIMNVYHAAQEIMIRTGNATQWGHSYPSEALVRDDIGQQVSYVLTNGEGRVCGVFAFLFGEEETYHYIEDGSWLNDKPYATIHRIASDGSEHGIFRSSIEFCKSLSDNIRIDTHHNNKIMQSLIEKSGFSRCGIIYVTDGSARIAYQYVK
ncbi:MAG: N-acetyltransferase [Treponemataceae bacterium]|nr:N-acetyltransferase [Treponemataceae bacterium]